MWLAAAFRRVGDYAGVVERPFGSPHWIAVRRVGAHHDGVAVRSAVETLERVRKIDSKIAIAPRVERIAVSGQHANHLLSLSAHVGVEWWQIDVRFGSDVENEFGLAA